MPIRLGSDDIIELLEYGDMSIDICVADCLKCEKEKVEGINANFTWREVHVCTECVEKAIKEWRQKKKDEEAKAILQSTREPHKVK